MTLHFNIGSNSGHRHALIEQAVAALSSAFAGTLRRSEFLETDPWGFSSNNRFLNIAVSIVLPSPIPPLRVLDITQDIQRSIDPSPHRDASGAYIDRAIDIDIIAIDRIVLHHRRLTLPHPRAHLRDFVLIPLREIDPSTAQWIETTDTSR